MRLIMTLLVRDEIDVLAACVEHHIAAGVDLIIATDNGSVDGTAELLAEYADAGVVELHHEPAQDYEQGRWVTRMARRAAEAHGADWVINGDADEFHWPPSLKDALSTVDSEYGTVELRRDNLVADPAVTGGWPHRLVLRDTESLSTRGTRIGPKSAHRGDQNVVVAQGNHGVSGPLIGPAAPRSPMEILHVPDRSYEQFSRKITNGGAAYAANTRLPTEVGWHWRDDYALLLDGELPTVYAARQRDADAVAKGLAAGTLVRDTRLRDRLESLVPQAILPDALRAMR
ncbi:glycosyltransferase involved in cell wall biosynthesis [Herbihabitans rhizosphaerae]|uniref:Glycosyltransferase involved in cell wall biosynthesis n=1 Tax=Herbihabitans rhizosphaerae TaxID=1872711 RepID=A0A4V2EUD7_9PSEU|nr:glycosyltransferase family 2 protein [Herbihabitans rhizosphaerae]RZS44213.1 glycosyltransferase involved in cell wall biosynthesis [Herbihabitans rhizosphaerae]